MNKQLHRTVCALVAIMTASSVGCSAGFRSGSSTQVAGQSAASATDQVAKSQAAVQDSQKAMESATTAVSGMLTSTGTIDLSVFEPASGGSVLAPIIAKLQPIFDEVFAKVQAVKTQLDASKAAIAAAMANLSPTDPNYVIYQKELSTITDLENQFDTQVHNLANQLSLVNGKIDALIAQLSSAIPVPGIGVILGVLIDTFVVDDVHKLINDLHDKLMAL